MAARSLGCSRILLPTNFPLPENLTKTHDGTVEKIQLKALKLSNDSSALLCRYTDDDLAIIFFVIHNQVSDVAIVTCDGGNDAENDWPEVKVGSG